MTWLGEVAPQLAPVYLGAVRMVADESFPGRVHFVWHSIREIRNRLPDAIAGIDGEASVDYQALVEMVATKWIEAELPSEWSLPVVANAEPQGSGPAGLEIPGEVVLAIEELLRAHRNIDRRVAGKAERMFTELGGVPPQPYVINAWKKIGAKAHGLAHVGTKALPDRHGLELSESFSRFEAALSALANRSFENMDALDDILGTANQATA